MTRTVHTHDTKLASARPVPGRPAYYVRPDGRVIVGLAYGGDLAAFRSRVCAEWTVARILAA